jgi:SAM-dependent methyltransferase
MDISGNLVRYMLRWVGQDHVVGVEGDAESLPFACRSFDLIILTETLEHLLDPSHALAEIARLLRPEGHLVLTVPNKNRLTVNPFALIRCLWGSFISRGYRHRNEALFHGKARMFFVHNAFRPRELHLLAAGAGLDVLGSGSFHLSLLDRLRAGSPALASGLEKLLFHIPVFRLFGRYSYAVMQPLVTPGPALDGEQAGP